jgi:spore germination protein KA
LEKYLKKGRSGFTMFKKRLKQSLKKLQSSEPYSEQDSSDDIQLKEQSIDKRLDKNLNVFRKIYSMPKNIDIKIRELFIPSLNKQGAILYISSIIDTMRLDDFIIRPLLTRQDSASKVENLVSTESIKNETKIREILLEVNKGSCVLFIEGDDQAYVISIPKFETRSIGQPENEVSLRGPKEAFSEKAISNISLVRKKIKNENLVVESAIISKRSNNDFFMAYVKDLANEELIQKVKERIDSLDSDSIHNLSVLEQLIEDRPRSLFPTVLYTERPDRAAYFLEDGYIVMFMDNSPAALIVPATFWSFYHTSDDRFLRFFNGNFSRFIRILGLFITLFTSAIYVSVTNYHAEMVPPDLLLAMASNREKVPFPSFVEVILMELAFELIREAGLRVPSPIGPTIGIVGALILGQAAVQANIVSPIVVIVVALGGLSSFVIGDISMNFAIRLIRFIIIVAAGVMGIYGMTAVFVIGLFYLVSIKSFGIPYLAPLTPNYKSSKDIIFRRLTRNEMFRPGYLRPKDIKKRAGDS